MSAYYNEIDPFAAAWLRELIKAGHIAQGEVDERSIEDVAPDDIAGFDQCHFFAGIGVWSYALRNAGWPDDRQVWTGSCPCQPFSIAGRGEGFSDKRHLWPVFFRLISKCRPDVVFGEQVASNDGLAWLDTVYADMEKEDYAIGAVDTCAAGFGAPHVRQRLYWVAESVRYGEGYSIRVGNSRRKGLEGQPWYGGEGSGWQETPGPASKTGTPCKLRTASKVNGFWRDADWLFCRDGKWRPVESGTFPLANGASARVGRLRGYGNAINAQQAEKFITAFMEWGEYGSCEKSC